VKERTESILSRIITHKVDFNMEAGMVGFLRNASGPPGERERF
jgi:hypothetical protein